MLGHTPRWSHAKLGGAPPVLSVGIKSFDIGAHLRYWYKQYLLTGTTVQILPPKTPRHYACAVRRPDEL